MADARTEQRPPARKRNRRGEGFRLREDIVSAATRILERTGSEEAVTLRAVAREIGIAAPSISAHFADRAAIVDAVVAKELAALFVAMKQAAEPVTLDPVERVIAICRAYFDYAQANPARYRTLLGRRYLEDWEAQSRIMEETAPIMAACLELVADSIQACISAGVTDGSDAYTDTLILWFTVHGIISVPQAVTSLNWPDLHQLLVTCVSRAIRLKEPRQV